VETAVEIGSVGTTLTQVTSGLQAGAQVVLADLSAAIPTSTASNSRFGRVNAGSGSLLGGSSAGAGVVVNGGAGFGPPPG
jgi:hypothetical protein